MTKPKRSKGKNDRQQLLAHSRASMTLTQAIEDYLLDHEGGNHSPKTLEWHRTALGLLQTYLEQERGNPFTSRFFHQATSRDV